MSLQWQIAFMGLYYVMWEIWGSEQACCGENQTRGMRHECYIRRTNPNYGTFLVL